MDASLLNEIKLSYLNGESLTQIAKKFKLKIWTVYKNLKPLGIVRTRKDSLLHIPSEKRYRKYNPHAFDEIGIKEAYFLGLLFSDGCICKTTQNRKMITLTSLDAQLIKGLNEILQNTSPLKERMYNGKNVYSMSVCGDYLYNRMLELGCSPNKSHTLNPPNIEERFYLPFILGYFDGDGCLSLNRRINSWKAAIGTASFKIKDWIDHYFKRYGLSFSITKSKIKNGDFYHISVCGIAAKFFMNILYDSLDGEVIPLQRKYEKYLEMMSCETTHKPKFKEWEKELMLSETDDIQCSKKIREHPLNYGWERTPQNIQCWRKRYLRLK